MSSLVFLLDEENNRKVNNLFVIEIASLIGFGAALYLSYGFYTKKDLLCLFFPKSSCKRVLESKYSRLFFTIPNSYIGLLTYIGIMVCTVLFSLGFVPFWPVQVAIVIGFAFSTYFIYIQMFVVKAYCSWCIISALSFFVMLLVALV